MTVRIRARAPLRVGLLGGGTDLEPYCTKHGGLVLSATISEFVFSTANYSTDDNTAFVQAIIDELDDQVGAKLHVETYSEAPPGSGLGSSSAYVVSTIKAVAELLRMDLPKYRLAETAVKLEREALGVKCGRQDQFGASFGGMNMLEFNERTVVQRLSLNVGVLGELRAMSMLVNTDKTRASSNIIERQMRSYAKEAPETMWALEEMKRLTMKGKAALLRGDLEEFANLVNLDWREKKKLDQEISNPEIDALISGGLANGAVAGKLLGAGGSGHILFMVPLERRVDVIKFLATKNLRHTPFGWDQDGAVAWRVEEGGSVPV